MQSMEGVDTMENVKNEKSFSRYIMKELVNQRIKMGISQRKWAEMAGTTRENINNWENLYRIPKFDQIIKLANALGINVRIIMTNKTGNTVLEINTDSNN